MIVPTVGLSRPGGWRGEGGRGTDYMSKGDIAGYVSSWPVQEIRVSFHEDPLPCDSDTAWGWGVPLLEIHAAVVKHLGNAFLGVGHLRGCPSRQYHET